MARVRGQAAGSGSGGPRVRSGAPARVAASAEPMRTAAVPKDAAAAQEASRARRVERAAAARHAGRCSPAASRTVRTWACWEVAAAGARCAKGAAAADPGGKTQVAEERDAAERWRGAAAGPRRRSTPGAERCAEPPSVVAPRRTELVRSSTPPRWPDHLHGSGRARSRVKSVSSSRSLETLFRWARG